MHQAVAEHREEARLREGHGFVVQRAVLEAEDQLALNMMCLDGLKKIPVSNDLALHRADDE